MIAKNLDEHTADGFDSIWKTHGAAAGGEDDDQPFETYFAIFPLERLTGAEGFDLGCGNGRIARSVAPLAGMLHCIDQSSAAIAAVKQTMMGRENVRFHRASVDSIPLPDESQDFGYSLGVLHHLPDPEAGLRSCVRKLKKGAPLLLYLYYSLDNRPGWFRLVWRASDAGRRVISKLPFPLRKLASDGIAATVYWPLSRSARLLRRLGMRARNVPLADYADHTWATLRADSLDRFGTSVEHRFSRIEIEGMMTGAGLADIRFADGPPYWVALGYKA